MSYGLFNWWWGEDTKDTQDTDWSWLIKHLGNIITDVSPVENTNRHTLSLWNLYTNPSQKLVETYLGWLDFRFLSISEEHSAINSSVFDVDTVEGITNIANWMERNIKLPDGTGNYNTISNNTITAFVKALKTHRPFYEENIKGGEPFVWVPKLPKEAQELWWGEPFVKDMNDDFWRKIDRLFMDIGEGYICINPEANRVITKFLSLNWTAEFEDVAFAASWHYPEWYLRN